MMPFPGLQHRDLQEVQRMSDIEIQREAWNQYRQLDYASLSELRDSFSDFADGLEDGGISREEEPLHRFYRMRHMAVSALLSYIREVGTDVPSWEELGAQQRKAVEANGTLLRIAQAVLFVRQDQGGVSGLTFTEMMDQVDRARQGASAGSGAARRYVSQHVHNYERDPEWWVQWAEDVTS
jgi:hypothetical protein